MPRSPHRIEGPLHRLGVKIGHGHVLADELDILVPLDEMLRDPGGPPVAVGLEGQFAAGCGDPVPEHPVVRIGIDLLDRIPPFPGGGARHIRTGAPELTHRLHVLDRRVHAEREEGLELGEAIEAGLAVIGLPLVDRDRQAVRLLTVESPHQAFAGRHGDVSSGRIGSRRIGSHRVGGPGSLRALSTRHLGRVSRDAATITSRRRTPGWRRTWPSRSRRGSPRESCRGSRRPRTRPRAS